MKFKKSVIINQPVAEVFGYISDFSHSTLWASPVLASQWLESETVPPRIGCCYKNLVKFLDRQLEVIYQIIEFEPNQLITSKTIAGWLPSLVSYAIEPLANSTRLIYHQEIELTGLFKRFEPVLQKSLDRQIEQDLTTLKDWLESGLYTQI